MTCVVHRSVHQTRVLVGIAKPTTPNFSVQSTPWFGKVVSYSLQSHLVTASFEEKMLEVGDLHMNGILRCTRFY